MTSADRREFLATAAVVALSATPSTADPAAGTDDHEHRDASDDPLDGLDSSVHAEGYLSESVTVDARSSERWNGQRWVPVVDLSLRFGTGDLCVTLDEATALALAGRLRAPFDLES